MKKIETVETVAISESAHAALKALAKAFHDGQNALDKAVNTFLKTGEATFSLVMAKELKSDYMALKGASDGASRQMLMTVRKRLEKAGIVIEKSARGGANNAGKAKQTVAKVDANTSKKGVTAKTLTMQATDSAAIKQVRGLFAQFGSKWSQEDLAALMDDLDVLMSYVEQSALNTK